MEKVILAIILGIVSSVCFVISFLQLCEKMTLLNNTYIYSSKSQREAMDKKPYYKQSGVIFGLVGIIFLLNTIEAILQTNWLFYLVMLVTVATIVYAVASTATINKNKK